MNNNTNEFLHTFNEYSGISPENILPGTFREGDYKFPDNVEITGNLTVNGTTITINTENLIVEDPLIKIGNNNTLDTNTGIYWCSSNNSVFGGLVKEGGSNNIYLLSNTSEPTTVSSLTGLSRGTLYASNINLNGIASASNTYFLKYNNSSGVITYDLHILADVFSSISYTTDNKLCRFDSTSGKLIQDCSVICDDSGNLTGIGSISASSTIYGSNINQDVSSSGQPLFLTIRSGTGISTILLYAYNTSILLDGHYGNSPLQQLSYYADQSNGFYVRPIRSSSSGSSNILTYDTSRYEMMYTTIENISGLSTSELNQLRNIDNNTVSNVRWGYVATMQDVSSTSSPTYVNLTLTGGVLNSRTLATDAFNLDTLVSRVNQALNTSSSPTFTNLTLSGGSISTDQIAIGTSALSSTPYCITMGVGANYQGTAQTGSVNIGYTSSHGFVSAVGLHSVQIGTGSGWNNSGNYSVNLGAYSAYDPGNTTARHNSIILNATGDYLNGNYNSSFTVKPIRSASGTNTLFYNSTSGEITYQPYSFNQNLNSTSAVNFSEILCPYVDIDSGDLAMNGGRILGNVSFTGNISMASLSTIDGRDISEDGKLLDTVVSRVDQSLTTGSSPTFYNAYITRGLIVNTSGHLGSGLVVYNAIQLATGDLTLTTGNIVLSQSGALVDGVDLSSFKSDYDSKINQAVLTSSSPTFSNLTLTGNLTLSTTFATVDGVDLSLFKSDYDSKINQGLLTSNRPTFSGINMDNIQIGGASNSSSTSMVSVGYFSNSSNNAGVGSIQMGYGSSYGDTNGAGQYSTNIGHSSAYFGSGNYSVNLGYLSGCDASDKNPRNNSICINASGGYMNPAINSSFNVKPVRNASNSNTLRYNTTTGEITYEAYTMNQNLNTSSNVQYADCKLTGNLTLPTTGGTASNLNFYMEENLSSEFKVFNSTYTTNIELTRIGRMVNMTIAGISLTSSGAGNDFFEIKTAIGSKFRPYAVDLDFPIATQNNASYKTGYVRVYTTGNIRIYYDITRASGYGSGFVNEFQSIGVSWSVYA